MTITPDLRRLIDSAAHYVSLPRWRNYTGPEWLEGLILAESGGDAGATRYEAHQDRQADGDSPNVDDGLAEDDRSYGLMQIMGTNLRRMVGVAAGVPMEFSWALRPLANLAFGLRILCDEIRRAEDQVGADAIAGGSKAVDIALARYNGGGRGNAPTDYPRLRNWSYVERLERHAASARADRKAIGWRVVG